MPASTGEPLRIVNPTLRIFTLADHAAVPPDTKLYVSGAGVQRHTLQQIPGVVGQLYLVVKVSIPWLLASEPHRFSVRLLGPDGEVIGTDPLFEGSVETGRPPGTRHEDELDANVILGLAGLPIPRAGMMYFYLSFDGVDMGRLPLRIVSAAQAPASSSSPS